MEFTKVLFSLASLVTHPSMSTAEDDAAAGAERWVSNFLVVSFDIDLGPTVEVSCSTPGNALSAAEERLVACLSMPDSNSGHSGDTTYVYRLRRGQRAGEPPLPLYEAAALSHSFDYAFVFFRQERDPAAKRGFLQKSFVLLSRHPFLDIFTPLVAFST